MKILVFGASGSGTTTLGKEIEKKTCFVHLDVDDYYWEKTEPSFQSKIRLDERNKNLKFDFQKHQQVIISGSMVSWGKEWETAFDLAIFIHLDNELRMERLRNREQERYGEKLIFNQKTRQGSAAFLEWASQYENPNFDGRSLKIHNTWIEKLECKVLRIDGDLELDDKVKKVLDVIVSLQSS